MPPESILDLLDDLGESFGATVPEEFLLAILAALREVAMSDEEVQSALRKRLQTLVSLLPLQVHAAIVEDLIAIALEASRPLCLEGRLPSADVSLISLIEHSSRRWLQRKDSISTELQVDRFLFQQQWTTSTVSIVCDLLYRRSYSEEMFSSWLASDQCTGRSMPHLATVLFAILDSAYAHADTLSGATWGPLFSRFVEISTNDAQPETLRSLCASCLCTLLKLVDEPSQSVASLAEAVKSLPHTTLTNEILTVGIQLSKGHLKDASTTNVLSALTDHALQWLVRIFGGGSQIPVPVIQKLSQFSQILVLRSNLNSLQ